MGEGDYFGIVTVTVMVILLLYATFGALFEAKHVDILNVKIFYIKCIVSSDPWDRFGYYFRYVCRFYISLG